jgi:hypothetical protein
MYQLYGYMATRVRLTRPPLSGLQLSGSPPALRDVLRFCVPTGAFPQGENSRITGEFTVILPIPSPWEATGFDPNQYAYHYFGFSASTGSVDATANFSADAIYNYGNYTLSAGSVDLVENLSATDFIENAPSIGLSSGQSTISFDESAPNIYNFGFSFSASSRPAMPSASFCKSLNGTTRETKLRAGYHRWPLTHHGRFVVPN